MEQSDEIKALLTAPASLSDDDLRAMVKRYPYFSLPAITLLNRLGDSIDEAERQRLRRHLAVATGDRQALYELASDESDRFDGIYPPQPTAPTITTDKALDIYFANCGTTSDAETALIERLIFNPVPDYSEVLLAQEKADIPADDSIPTIPERPVVAPPASEVPPQPKPAVRPAEKPVDDGSLLSESLAKMFIKQGRYERAYEIISAISLKYPKKSVYFADQMRFLQKLIRVQQLAQASQQ